jgi:hypothetical protein
MVGCELVISGRDTTARFDLVEEPFGQVARTIQIRAEAEKKRPDGSPFKVREYIPHDSWSRFGRLNHVQTDAFNRQNRTIGISEINPEPDMLGHAKIDENGPWRTYRLSH